MLGVAGSLINSIILVVVLWGVVNGTHLLLWMLCVMLISIIRMNLQHKYKKIDKNQLVVNKWKNVYLITLAISGLIWGSAAVALFPPASIGHQSFIAFVLGGMVAGSVGVFSVVLTAFLAFSLPALLPITLRFFLTGGQIHLAMGTMISLFWLIMFMTARRLHKDILDYFSLKYENKDLISELEAEVDIRKTAESELKKKNLEIERIVNQRTSELQETNRKLTAEIEERRSITNALQESEEKYRDLAENINDVIYSTANKGVITYINPAIKSSIGYDPQEIIGKNFADYIHKDDLARIWEKFTKVLAGKLGFDEYRIRAKTNAYHWIRSSSQVIMKEDRVVGTRGSFTDITEKKKLEERLRQSLKMEAIGTLAGGIAHEFNNVLSIIIGNSELALDDIPDQSLAKQSLKEILAASMRAKDVVRQILSFSRQTTPERKPINIGSLIRGNLALLRASIPSTIDIQFKIPDDTDTILGDPTHINQVLMNLCTNAVDSMSDKGGTLQINLENVIISANDMEFHPDMAIGKYVKLIVRDTGHGIDSEDILRIFDPYYTTKEVGKGTGLGLAVVHGIVKNHGGDISLKSELNKGTSFEVFFPSIDVVAETETHIEKEHPKGTERILIVDDEDSIVKLNHQRLERLGYRVESTTDPLEALELFGINHDKFDLVITDMTMPLMTGDRLAKEMLKLKPDTPIILCTGYSEKISKENAKEMGIRKYIEKPIDKRELAIIIREVLNEKQEFKKRP